MKLFIVTLLTLFLVSCSSFPVSAVSLPPKDNTLAPINGNLYTQEVATTYESDLGLNGDYYDSTKKEDLDNKFLRIPVTYKGEYSVRSRNCIFSQSEMYERSTVIHIPYSRLLQNKPSKDNYCKFEIYTKPERLDSGMRGEFILVDMKGLAPAKVTIGTLEKAIPMPFKRLYNGVGWYQMREDFNPNIQLNFQTETEGTYDYEGCGKSGKGSYKNGLGLPLGELYGDRKMKNSCTIFIGLLPSGSDPVQYFAFNLQIFSSDIIPMPDPMIYRDGKYIKARANKAEVALISINRNATVYYNKLLKTAKGRYNSGRENFVRIFSANGRSNLYIYRTTGRLEKWMSVVY